MFKMNKRKIISIALTILMILTLTNNVFATAFDPEEWDPEPTVEAGGSFLERAGSALGWIRFIGIIVSVLALVIIGIKYMLASIDEKAEYKKTMIPYIIGCFMLMGVSILVGLIEGIANS